MSPDRLKEYVRLHHKAELAKHLKLAGYALSGLVIIVLVVIFMMKWHFDTQVTQLNEENNKRLDTLLVHRDAQVNMLQAGITMDHVRQWRINSVEKIIMHTQRNVPMEKKLKQEPRHNIATWIVDESARHDLDIALVTSVIAQESKFNMDAISAMQAHGLMQVVKETGKWLSKELGVVYTDQTRLDPKLSIKMGTWYLKWLLSEYNKDVTMALGHYNGGSNQARAFVLTPTLKNHPDYKRPKNEVNSEYEAFRERKLNGEMLNQVDSDRYALIEKIRCAQSLSVETEKYIPEILERKAIFQKMLDDPSAIRLREQDNPDLFNIKLKEK
jgi:hypothetical protein